MKHLHTTFLWSFLSHSLPLFFGIKFLLPNYIMFLNNVVFFPPGWYQQNIRKASITQSRGDSIIIVIDINVTISKYTCGMIFPKVLKIGIESQIVLGA